MSETKATAIWREIKPFAIRDINSMLDDGKTNSGGDDLFILLYDLSAQKIRQYSVSAAGLTGAIAASEAGDSILIPSCSISGNYTMKAGVTVQGVGDGTILTGTIINNGILTNLKIVGNLVNNLSARYVSIYCSSGTGYTQTLMAGSAAYCSVNIDGDNVIGASITGGRIVYFIVGYLSGSNTTGMIIDGADVEAFFIRTLADHIGIQVGQCDIMFSVLGLVQNINGTALVHTTGNASIGNSYFSNMLGGPAIDATVAGLTLTDCDWNGTTTGSWVSGTGDRAVFDALNYQALHANDIDLSTGIHHTLDELDLRYSGAGAAPNGPPFFLPVATNGLSGFATQHMMQSAILYGNNKTFVFYLGDDYDEWCTIYDHITQIWSVPVEITDGHAADNHNYLSAVFDEDGYIHIFYGCHDSDLYYKKSTNPYDISTWSVETTLAPFATYPKALMDSSGGLYIFYREDRIVNAARLLQFRKSIDNGATWATAVTIVDSGDDDWWVYPGFIGLGTDDSIHVIFTWRHGLGGAQEEFFDVGYMKSMDWGTTWEESDGTPYVLPVAKGDEENIATGQYLFAASVALDEDNNPQVVYVETDTDVYFTKNHIHYCYLSGGVWQDVTMAEDDYELSVHILVDGSVFYIFASQLISGKYEIIMFQSLDSGAIWTKYQLTTGSALDNININIKMNTNGGLEIIWTQATGVWYMSEDWIIQLRLGELGTGILADHDHSGDVGDGGTFDVANLTSGVAPNDYVLTSDGIGGAAFETPGIGSGQYRQFLYTVVGGDPTFLTDDDGNLLTVALDLE